MIKSLRFRTRPRRRSGRLTLFLPLLVMVLLAPLPADAQQRPGHGFEAYRLRDAQAHEIEPRLRELLSGLADDEAEIVVDSRGNRLLVRGSAEVQQVARDLIESLDRSGRPQAASKPVLKSYPYSGADPDALASRLQDEYPAASGVRIAADDRTGQILVLAPPHIQSELARRLESRQPAFERPPGDAGDNQVSRVLRTRAAAAQAHSPTVQLRQLRPEQLQSSLSNLWGEHFSGLAKTRPEVDSYLVRLPDQQPLEIDLNRRTGKVTLRGPVDAATHCARLIEALDAPAESRGRSTRVVAVPASTSTHVRRAMDAVTNQGNGNALPPRHADGAGSLPMVARLFRPRAQVESEAQDLQDQQQQEQPPDEGAFIEDDQLVPDQLTDEDAAVLGQVQIEYLEGLDAIIIRGNRRDVERVLQIIDDIERLSVETEPVIEVYTLRHVDSQAMADLIRPLYDDFLAPRQGRVSITALVKPNALLLVGRAATVKSVTDLLARLDQPVGPTGQFRLFRLRHAPASVAAQTITQFFGERAAPGQQPTAAGLAPRVAVTADFRTNSLIVQASPRDLVEVARLIQGLDTISSDAVNELRVFRLRNALAEELAPVLQEAISSQAVQAGRPGQFGDGAFQPTPGQPGAQPGLPGAQGAQAQQAKSLTLQFLTVDAEGQRLVNSGILTDVRITADPRANSLLVSAPAESIDLLAALIAQLDQPPEAAVQIKVFTIINGDAASLAQLLEELFGSPTGQQAGQQGQFGPQPLVTGGEGSLLPLRFSVDPRTNSIIASGSASDLAVVHAILLRLDESDVRERRSSIYRLKNAPAEAVAAAINEFLTTERDVQQITPELLSPFEQIEREVVVVPELVSNSLIISATPRFYDEIIRLVEELDARPPMVMIQVLIAEVTLNNTDEFGIELGLQDSVLFDRSLLGDIQFQTVTTQQAVPGGGTITTTDENVITATNIPGFIFNNLPLGNSGSAQSLATRESIGSQGLTSFAVGRTNGDLGFGGLVLSASSESVSILVRALKESRRLDVLSRPQIMTLDNQPALILVGQRVPFITQTALTPGVGQTNTIAFENVGLVLGVTPRISPDGLVVMEINAEKSQVGPEAEGIPISINATGEVIRSPRIDATTAQTTISAMDGQTVVFAGLITKSKTEVRRRVPLLSEIPILGNLFRYDGVSGRKTELLIIMTPRIVRNEAHAEVVKRDEAARMSWCLADVQKLHGNAGLRGRGDEWADGETITIYPDGAPTPAAIDGEILPPPAGPRLVPEPPEREPAAADPLDERGMPLPQPLGRREQPNQVRLRHAAATLPGQGPTSRREPQHTTMVADEQTRNSATLSDSEPRAGRGQPDRHEAEPAYYQRERQE
ncbi:MAG: secretin N-terminal domain-containing protein [Pirellulales bacterium]